MAIATSDGAKVYIGPVQTAALPTKAAYDALPWKQIGSVQSLSDFGDTANIIQYESLPQRRVRKAKGTDDGGSFQILCANDPLNLGQLALLAARGGRQSYAIKVVLSDQADEDDTNSSFYFIAKIISAKLSVGDAQSMVMRSFVLDIDSAILEAPSLEVSTGNSFDFSNSYNLLFGEFGGAI